MQFIDVRVQLETDDASVVDLLNRTDPHHAPLTVELYRGEYASRAAGAGLIRLVAVADGTLVGTLSLEEVTQLQTPNVYFVVLAVSPEWQRRGIGRAMATAMDDAAARPMLASSMSGCGTEMSGRRASRPSMASRRPGTWIAFPGWRWPGLSWMACRFQSALA